jgi:hypothetical protein
MQVFRPENPDHKTFGIHLYPGPRLLHTTGRCHRMASCRASRHLSMMGAMLYVVGFGAAPFRNALTGRRTVQTVISGST